jgi:hypothetical protein
MGVLLVIGQHNKITSKEKNKICDCWFPKREKPIKKGNCKCTGCFLDREEKWRKLSTVEQTLDDNRRGIYAKEITKTIVQILETFEKTKKIIGRGGA